jgi:glycosyltransferase involved in cell wall biosynthesis
MRILFLSAWFPHPPDNGAKLRIHNLLRILSQHHDVTLLCFSDKKVGNEDVLALRALCRDVQVVPKKSFQPRSLRARLGFLSPLPRSEVDTFSPQMARSIQNNLLGGNYDLVIASELAMAGYVGYLSGTPALFEDLELGVLYEQYASARSPWHRVRYGLTWLKYCRYVAWLLGHFSTCTVASERERQLVGRVMPGYGRVEVIPNCLDLNDYAGVKEILQHDSLIFTGSFRYCANHDAAVWFLRQVYPHIQARVPDVRLTITGDHAGYSLPAVDNVILTGLVDDLRPLIARSWQSVCPLRIGAGTRVKIIESMALGTPVVSTSKGAEGLEVTHGENILIADTPDEFARAVIELLQDPGLREKLSTGGRRLVMEKYSSDVMAHKFNSLLEWFVAQRAAA